MHLLGFATVFRKRSGWTGIRDSRSGADQAWPPHDARLLEPEIVHLDCSVVWRPAPPQFHVKEQTPRFAFQTLFLVLQSRQKKKEEEERDLNVTTRVLSRVSACIASSFVELAYPRDVWSSFSTVGSSSFSHNSSSAFSKYLRRTTSALTMASPLQ
eukprot:3932937-Rhodomonas_salina.3